MPRWLLKDLRDIAVLVTCVVVDLTCLAYLGTLVF